MSTTEIVDGVKITTDDNGVQHFEAIPDAEEKGFWSTLWDFISGKKTVKPYVKLRKMSDPIKRDNIGSFDDGSGSKHSVEIGICVNF